MGLPSRGWNVTTIKKYIKKEKKMHSEYVYLIGNNALKIHFDTWSPLVGPQRV